MKHGSRLLFSIYITFIVYSLLSLVWGAAGILQTSMLKVYKNKLVQNTIELGEISNQLDLQFDRLRTDEDLIALKARELGFFREGEGELILKGYKKNSISYSVGSYYKNFNKKVTDNSRIRLFSTIIGILSFLLMTILKDNSNVHRRKNRVGN
ncbi:MAG: septum formation initiator family protein [Spirochaetales bacterium]|nr:septum formation initiator family protein [Spirochaetales bacterium]